MKLTATQLALVLAASLICAPAAAAKKDKKGKDAVPQGMTPEMMQKWQAYSTPGEAHRALDPMVGSWTYTMKFWTSPDAKPETSVGTSESKWILGGRFVESFVNGTSMGQPFEGRSILGYDNQKKEYTSVWIDNMATGMMVSDGSYDAGTKTLSQTGTMSCPMEDSKTLRGVTTLTGNDSHTYEMFGAGPDGKEFRMMQITYARKK